MKIALFEPYSHTLIRGNSIAAERLASSLRKQAVHVRTFSLRDAESKREILSALQRFKPKLLHGFHACKTGPLVQNLSQKLNIPYIISLRGTDAYEDAFKQPACKTMSDVLNGARTVVVFHPSMKRTVLKRFPDVRGKVSIIPQGVSKYFFHPLTSVQGRRSFNFGYAGGLRKLKGVHEIIRNLTSLQKTHPEIHFYIAGPAIEKPYAKKILSEIKKLPWITYFGEIPHKRIASFYALLDVYVNASSSEGTSNAVLEAEACGKCVLASDVEGNRAVIQDGTTGVLYSSRNEFLKKAAFLIGKRAECRAIGKSAKESVKRKHSSRKEALQYRMIYSDSVQ